MLPMSSLLKRITHPENSMFLVGTTWSETLITLPEKLFLIWRSAGSPRHGPLYDLMKIKRAQFKRNKRHCEKMLNLLKLSDLLPI